MSCDGAAGGGERDAATRMSKGHNALGRLTKCRITCGVFGGLKLSPIVCGRGALPAIWEWREGGAWVEGCILPGSTAACVSARTLDCKQAAAKKPNDQMPPYAQCASTTLSIPPRSPPVALPSTPLRAPSSPPTLWSCLTLAKSSGYHLSPTSTWLLTRFINVASPKCLHHPLSNVNSTSSLFPPTLPAPHSSTP